MSKKDQVKEWQVSRDRPFFVYSSNDRFAYFATRAERDAMAEQVLEDCKDVDESWTESADWVVSGVVTHLSGQVNRVERPESEYLDENDCDGSGQHWGDWAYMCGYRMLPLAGDKPPSPCQLLAQAAELVMLAGQALKDGKYSVAELNSEQFLVLRHGIAKAARDLNQLHSSAGWVETIGK